MCSLPKSMSGVSVPSHSVKGPDFRRSIDERYQGRFNDQKQGFPSASPHTFPGSSRCAGNISRVVRCSAPLCVEPYTEATAGDGCVGRTLLAEACVWSAQRSRHARSLQRFSAPYTLQLSDGQTAGICFG